MELNIGNQAPIFEAKDQAGNIVKLSNFQGKKVILYFYPQDDTETCTIQACNLRDNYHSVETAGYTILGVSPDDECSHLKFIQKYNLPFTLIADIDKTLHELYGVWQEKQMFGRKYMGTIRTTFIIDEAGKITDIIRKVKSKEHTKQILKS
jgi:peroxiredoxin Q/BCP